MALVGAAGCDTRTVNIEGHAMAPTLNDGDKAVATRSFERVDRGDIVVFRYPRDEGKSFLKRVVGLPGERIEAAHGRITIDGQPLEEPYVAAGNQSHETFGPITVPDDEYFVMGDNRRNSSDSRHWGTVRRSAVWAKVVDR